MSDPLISIIIPCYNNGQWVGDAIRSALEQTYANKEVIVIDDGSTDNSLEVIRSFGSQIRWESLPHGGAPIARNRGLEMALGERIQFLDADDVLDARKIEMQLEAGGNRNDTLIFCDFRILTEENSPPMWQDRSSYQGNDPVEYVLRRQISTPAVLHWKSRLVDIGGFDEALPCAQEYDLHLRMVCSGMTLQHLPQALVAVRKHRLGISSNLTRVLEQYPRILWRAYTRLEERKELSDSRQRAFAETMAWGARQLLRQNQITRGIDFFREARRMHPDGGLGICSCPVRILHRLTGPALACRIMQAGRRRTTDFL